MYACSDVPETRLPKYVGTGVTNCETLAPGRAVCGTETDALALWNRVGAPNLMTAPAPATAPIFRTVLRLIRRGSLIAASLRGFRGVCRLMLVAVIRPPGAAQQHDGCHGKPGHLAREPVLQGVRGLIGECVRRRVDMGLRPRRGRHRWAR